MERGCRQRGRESPSLCPSRFRPAAPAVDELSKHPDANAGPIHLVINLFLYSTLEICTRIMLQINSHSLCAQISHALLIIAQSHHRMALCPCYRLLLENFAILCIGYNYSAREQDVQL